MQKRTGEKEKGEKRGEKRGKNKYKNLNILRAKKLFRWNKKHLSYDFYGLPFFLVCHIVWPPPPVNISDYWYYLLLLIRKACNIVSWSSKNEEITWVYFCAYLVYFNKVMLFENSYKKGGEFLKKYIQKWGGWSYRMGGLCHYVSECYGLMLNTCIHDLQKLAIF